MADVQEGEELQMWNTYIRTCAGVHGQIFKTPWEVVLGVHELE